ncbi:Nop52-domain-containing protein [Collybia nuda]|uniref:Nop52-domain-containing protein n=1 Tax=Collybia nuda TaxID=64659 RepID=A0A9P5XZY8_9AGAR|nr:Nop52-domain-containing protein [Collybia nuda]
MTTSSATPPLGKYLASTEKKTRDKAVKNLAIFLSDFQDEIPKPEMDKLWKGLFYSFWMSDKPLVQQALATELAELVLTITTTSSSLAFLRGFWETITREWNGIDRLRMDKYYMLVRRFVNASFRLLIRTEWDKSACDEYNRILMGINGPLCPSDIRVPTGLAYHLADIYVEELDKTLSTPSASAPPQPPVPLKTILYPFFVLASQTQTSITYKRIQSALFEPLFSALSPPSPVEDQARSQKRIRLSTTETNELYPNLVSNSCFDDTSEGKLGCLILKKKLLRTIFEIASQLETRDSNRRKMYAFWKEGSEDEDIDD